jgi:hypothetical protein
VLEPFEDDFLDPDDCVPAAFVPEDFAADDFAGDALVEDFAPADFAPADFVPDDFVPDDFAPEDRVVDDLAAEVRLLVVFEDEVRLVRRFGVSPIGNASVTAFAAPPAMSPMAPATLPA